MEYTTFGRTGLQVSVMGLGAGGHSRLGFGTEKSDADAQCVIRRAIELGVNVIDTAEAYGTEEVIGKAVSPNERSNLVLSSKYTLYSGSQLRNPAELEKSLDSSLRNLRTDYLDIYHLHAVKPQDYAWAVDNLVPEMLKMRDKGKLRFLGITEGFVTDPAHVMLERAVLDDMWDVIMVGFNVLNQSARDVVLRKSIEKNIAVLDMFAVRRALTKSKILAGYIAEMKEKGWLPNSDFYAQDPLGFLVRPDGAINLPDAAYRFVHYEPGIHCVLSGTGDISHLEANVASLNRPALAQDDVERVRRMFAGVNTVSGN